MGKKGRAELRRVKADARTKELQRRREIREQNLDSARAASEIASQNMGPKRQQLIEQAMKVQRRSEIRMFEGMSADQRAAMQEGALDKVFGEDGGLKGD